MIYRHLNFTESQIRQSLKLQNLAVNYPRRINIPADFTPRTQIDRRVMALLKRGTKEGAHDQS